MGVTDEPNGSPVSAGKQIIPSPAMPHIVSAAPPDEIWDGCDKLISEGKPENAWKLILWKVQAEGFSRPRSFSELLQFTQAVDEGAAIFARFLKAYPETERVKIFDNQFADLTEKDLVASWPAIAGIFSHLSEKTGKEDISLGTRILTTLDNHIVDGLFAYAHEIIGTTVSDGIAELLTDLDEISTSIHTRALAVFEGERKPVGIKSTALVKLDQNLPIKPAEELAVFCHELKKIDSKTQTWVWTNALILTVLGAAALLLPVLPTWFLLTYLLTPLSGQRILKYFLDKRRIKGPLRKKLRELLDNYSDEEIALVLRQRNISDRLALRDINLLSSEREHAVSEVNLDMIKQLTGHDESFEITDYQSCKSALEKSPNSIAFQTVLETAEKETEDPKNQLALQSIKKEVPRMGTEKINDLARMSPETLTRITALLNTKDIIMLGYRKHKDKAMVIINEEIILRARREDQAIQEGQAITPAREYLYEKALNWHAEDFNALAKTGLFETLLFFLPPPTIKRIIRIADSDGSSLTGPKDIAILYLLEKAEGGSQDAKKEFQNTKELDLSSKQKAALTRLGVMQRIEALKEN